MVSSPKQKAVELLSGRPSKEVLLNLISWLDMECSQAPLSSLPQQILARAVVALGYELNKNLGYETVAHTIRAAESFALEPTMENFDKYQKAATNSYPFGPGDGCYAVSETGYSGCELGSGCSSGSGCLYFSGLDETIVMEVIANDLLGWLQEEHD